MVNLRRSGFLLLAIVAGAGLILLAANLYLRTGLRASAIEDARQVLTHSAASYGSRIEHRLLNVESTLAAMALRIGSGTHTPRELHLLLQQAVQTLDIVRVLGVTDATGRVILSSRSDPPPDVSLAGRDYVDYFLAGGSAPRFLSAPVANLVDGQWQLSLAMPILARDGGLLGVISAVIDPRRLIDILRPTLPQGDFVTLLYADYRLVARIPWREDQIGRSLADAAIYRDHAQAGTESSAGVYTGFLSGDRRIGVALSIFHDRLVISTSRAFDTALGFWRYVELLAAAGSIVLFLLILLVSWLTQRRFVAERRHARVLQDLNARLQEESRRSGFLATAKEQFLANVSHDIRTPMNAVLSLSYLLGRTELTGQQRQYLEQIAASGRFLLELLDDILTFSRAEAGKIALENRPFALSGVGATLSAIMSANAAGRPVTASLDIDPAVPDMLLGDTFRLQQVLVNLVGNALKFTSKGEVSLRIEPVSVADRRAVLRFIVSDTGIGIDPELIPGLFDPFTQGDASTTRRFGGTGLGLSICKRLVTQMGGSIAVDSLPGQGSRFTVTLGFDRPAEGNSPLPAGQDSDENAKNRVQGLHVLLVDDNSVNQEVARQVLEMQGAAVTLVADGRQAVEALAAAANSFDIVLMDVQMPVMDGLSAAREIRDRLGLRDLPIIALTAAALDHDRERCLAAGMNDVLAKPISPDRLFAAIAAHARPAGGTAAPGGTAFPLTAATPPRDGAAAVDPLGPAIAGIDMSEASRLLDGNARLFEVLLSRLEPQVAGIAADLRADLAAGEPEKAGRRLHSFRGAAGNLAATRACALATELELALKAHRDEDWPGLLERFEAELATLLAALRRRLASAAPVVENGQAGPVPPARTGGDTGATAALLSMLEVQDVRALALFASARSDLEACLGTARTGELATLIENLRFAEARDLLDRASGPQ